MLAATQLGLIPPEVSSIQAEVVAITNKVRTAWPVNKRSYRSEDVRRIALSMNRAIGRLSTAIAEALADDLVEDRDDIVSSGEAGLEELQRFQKSLAIPVEQSRSGDTVDHPEFRTAIPAMMERTYRVWSSMGRAHDVFASWMTQDTAEAIAQGYRDILETVAGMKGAKSTGFFATHKGKLAAGAAIVGGGLGAYFFWWRPRSSHLSDPEPLPAEEPPSPVGVHVFGPQSEGVRRLMVGDPDGENVLIVGDENDRSELALVADMVSSALKQ